MDLDGVWFGAIVVADVTASTSFSDVLGMDESLLVDLGRHPEGLFRASVDATAASLALVLGDHGTGKSR
jgi:hypothetical protein